MTTESPSINWGSPIVPVYFKFQDTDGESYIVWAHLTQCGSDDYDLWLGVNSEEHDLILRGVSEMKCFLAWLTKLPTEPHLNSRYSTRVDDTRPDLADQYRDAEHMTIPCSVFLVKEVLSYVLGHPPNQLSAECYTSWPCTASRALADIMAPLVRACEQGTIDIRPTKNPLDREGA